MPTLHRRLPLDPAAKAGARGQGDQGRGRRRISSRVSFIAIEQTADQASWRLSAKARMVWRQLVADTCQRPSACWPSLSGRQPRHSSRCRNSSVVMRNQKRSAEPSVLQQPPRRGTSRTAPGRRSVLERGLGAASDVQESKDSGSRFCWKQPIRLSHKSYLIFPFVQVGPAPAEQVSGHLGASPRFRWELLRFSALHPKAISKAISPARDSDPEPAEQLPTWAAGNGHGSRGSPFTVNQQEQRTKRWEEVGGGSCIATQWWLDYGEVAFLAGSSTLTLL